LVDFEFPIKGKLVQVDGRIDRRANDGEIMIDITVSLPCTMLMQRIQIEVEDMFNASEDFSNVFEIDSVHTQYGGSFKESIMIVRNSDRT
jgi:hypothetical protein